MDTLLVDACLCLDHFPRHPLPAQDIDLFHTIAVVKVPDDVDFAFGDADAPVAFPSDLGRMNFRELPPRECFAVLAPEAHLDVRDDVGRDVFDTFFAVESGRPLTRRQVMLAMLTRDARIVRQDCLCCLMERIHRARGGARRNRPQRYGRRGESVQFPVQPD